MATDPTDGPPSTAVLAARWRDVRVAEVTHHDDHAVVLRLDVPDRVVHLPGQHYVLRLRAADGYTASRSYSIVSAPSAELVELYVERIPDGEVSSFLADIVEPGDLLEARGPIGRWFAWDGTTRALAIGGGSGVAPLVSMLRHAHDLGHPDLLVTGGQPAASIRVERFVPSGSTA